MGIAGFEELDIGETLGSSEECDPLPFVEIRSLSVWLTFFSQRRWTNGRPKGTGLLPVK